MEALLAGFVTGTAVGMLAWGTIAVALVRDHTHLLAIHARFPSGTALPFLMVGISMAIQGGCGARGIGTGAIYWAIRDEAMNGLGSPAWGFTLFFLVVAGLGLATVVVIQPSWWRRAVLGATTLAGAFGWMLPHLAEA